MRLFTEALSIIAQKLQSYLRKMRGVVPFMSEQWRSSGSEQSQGDAAEEHMSIWKIFIMHLVK